MLRLFFLCDEILADYIGLRFRWVACKLDELCLQKNNEYRRRALEQLPKILNETYEKILSRIPEQDVTLAVRALQ